MLLLFLITVKVPPKPKQAGNLKQKQIRRWADRIFKMNDSSVKKTGRLVICVHIYYQIRSWRKTTHKMGL